MKQTTTDSLDMLHKIEIIEKEIGDLKISVLQKLMPSGKKIVSLKGIIKNADITDKDMAEAKKSLYSKVKI